MATITFDTHKFIRTLKEAGIPENQAEAIAEAFKEAHLEARELEYRLIIKLGAMIALAIGIAAVLAKLL